MVIMNFKDLLSSKKMTMYKLAKEANLGQGTINEIANNKRKSIKLDTATKISKVLDVDIETIVKCIKEETDES